MNRYVYDKYNVIPNGYVPEYFHNAVFLENTNGQFAVNVDRNITLYEGYTWDYNLQRFVGTGSRREIPQGGGNLPGWFYFHDYGPNDPSYRVTEIGSESFVNAGTGVRFYKSRRVAERKSGATRGTFIERIATENANLPNDGVHTDGFWYDRIGIASKRTIVNITTQDSLAVGDGSTFDLTGNIVNQWYEAQVTVKYRINGGSTYNIATLNANSQPKNFSKNLRIEDGAVYDGTTVVAQGIPNLQWNNIEVWADGGEFSSETKVFTFSIGYPYLEADASLIRATSYLEELVPIALSTRLKFKEVELTAAEVLNQSEYVIDELGFEPKYALYYNTRTFNNAFGSLLGFASKDTPIVVANSNYYNYVSQLGATTNRNAYEESVDAVFRNDGVTLKAPGVAPIYYNNDIRILIFG